NFQRGTYSYGKSNTAGARGANPNEQEEMIVHLTCEELERMIEAAIRIAIIEYERRMISPAVREPVKTQFFKGKGKMITDDPKEMASQMKHDKEQELEKGHEKD
ncbi:UNVERIFIED_CONTAM: hypothetical protein Sindi_0103500, partial [Sesamum indicum]